MMVTHVQPAITVPVSEGTVLELVDADPVGRLVIVENLDDANTMYWKFQTSPDKSTWTDVSSYAALAPGAAVAVTLSSANSFHRLRAYGNLTASAAVLRHRAFTGVMPLINY
jgi:hypothetical protein